MKEFLLRELFKLGNFGVTMWMVLALAAVVLIVLITVIAVLSNKAAKKKQAQAQEQEQPVENTQAVVQEPASSPQPAVKQEVVHEEVVTTTTVTRKVYPSGGSAQQSATTTEVKKEEKPAVVEEPKHEEKKTEYTVLSRPTKVHTDGHDNVNTSTLDKYSKKEEEKPVVKARPVIKEEPVEEETEENVSDEKLDQYHVSQEKNVRSINHGKWRVRKSGSTKTIQFWPTQKEAIDHAKRLAKNNPGSTVIVHRVNGQIREVI